MGEVSQVLAGTLLASAQEAPQSNQIITIRNGLIERIEAMPPGAAPAGPDIVDARAHIVMPGLVNAHCHHTENLQRSARDRLPFELWRVERRGIEDVLRPGYDELLTVNLAALVEAAKHGTTSVLHHLSRRDRLHLDEVRACIDAAKAVGIRVTVAPSVADVGWQRIVPREGPADAMQDLRALAESMALIEAGPPTVRAMIGPSSLHGCSDGFLTRCLAMADHCGVGLHMHCLETRLEATQRSESGETPIQRARRLGILRPEVSLAHVIHVTDDELDDLGQGGPVLVHNPCSNLKLGSGFARVREMRRRGLTVALGSDGGDTSDAYSMFDQMKMAAVMRRGLEPDYHGWISAREALEMATLGGARSLGLRAGRLAPGHLADLCILRPGIRMWGATDLVQGLVYSENGASVDTVLVGGEVVLRGGISVRLDERRLEGDVRGLAARVAAAREVWSRRRDEGAIASQVRAAEHEYWNTAGEREG